MRIAVKGIGFDDLRMDEAVSRALALTEEPGGHYIVTPNPEMVWLARSGGEFAAALNAADLVVPDGIGIIYASRILGTPLKERVPGFELTQKLLAAAAERALPVYLLGAKPGVAERAAENLRGTYPGLNIVGMGDGYFKDDGPVLDRIRSSGARIALVCLGFPRQELWMARYREELGQLLMLGVGGSMDVFAGDVERAPEAWCRAGLEWLYRLIKQPSRIKRQIKLPLFLFSVIAERLLHGKAKQVQE